MPHPMPHEERRRRPQSYSVPKPPSSYISVRENELTASYVVRNIDSSQKEDPRDDWTVVAPKRRARGISVSASTNQPQSKSNAIAITVRSQKQARMEQSDRLLIL